MDETELNRAIHFKVNIDPILQPCVMTQCRLHPAPVTLSAADYNEQTLSGLQLPVSSPLLSSAQPCCEHLVKALLRAGLRLLHAWKPSEKRSQLQGTWLPLRWDSIYYHFPLPVHFKGIFATLCPPLIQEHLSFNHHQ